MSNERDYVLGTHDAEVERLGLQHRVWTPHTTEAWRRAGFTRGQTLLDLGCGPGYATLDLARIVGPDGRVIAVDRSRRFLSVLESAARDRGLANIEPHELDLDDQPLPDAALDGVWSRWVYAFVREPRRLLERVAAQLRPGGVLVLFEYVDYGAWRLSLSRPAFERFVAKVVESWRESGGEPDVGLDLPRWLHELGFELAGVRAITEFARPGDAFWAWCKAFVDVGLERLVDIGKVDAAAAKEIRAAFAETEATPGAFLMTPTVLALIARKP